jgi:hypothetical protein
MVLDAAVEAVATTTDAAAVTVTVKMVMSF